MRLAVEEAAVVELPPLERRIGTISAIARIAPLIGLLGTLLALAKGLFTLGNEDSYANASQLASLFSEAIITTTSGIAIMIIALLAHHFLMGRIKAIVHDMEWSATILMEYLLSDASNEDESSKT